MIFTSEVFTVTLDMHSLGSVSRGNRPRPSSLASHWKPLSPGHPPSPGAGAVH